MDVVKNISFKVDHQCPQCGAPVILEEETLFFECNFCRVRSCISQKGFFRYMFSLSKHAPKGCEVIYLPYWRFKGVRYTAYLTGVESRFMDISVLALKRNSDHIPFSLGLRSQALSLKLVSSKTQGRFIRPMAFQTAMVEPGMGPGSMSSGSMGTGSGCNQEKVFRDDIGETTSLIYSPFYIKDNRLFDGILNLPTGAVVPADFDPHDHDLCRPEKETLFIPGLCPGCGWNLEGHSNSLVLVCKNCHTLWKPKGKQLFKIRYGCAQPQDPDDAMIPFWKIKVKVDSFSMSSYADLVRMANLPRVIQPEWTGQAVYFWIPAFKIRPDIFLRLGAQLSLGQPDLQVAKKIHGNVHLPITLPSSEAAQSIRIILASLARPWKEHLPVLAKAILVPEEIGLVFLPFESQHQEYIFREFNLAISKQNIIKERSRV